MDLSKFGFVQAPFLHVKLNIGCLHDIPTGEYMIGKHGESILNGGLHYITGVAGKGNLGKSTYLHHMNLSVLSRYCRVSLGMYDTETTVARSRFAHLAKRHPNLSGIDLEDSGRVFFTDNTVMSGNAWFEATKRLAEARRDDQKKALLTTPFYNHKTKENHKIIAPYLTELDSLSMFSTDATDAIYEKNELGDSGANTDALRGGRDKSQMLMQLPTLTGRASVYMSFTIHVGDQHVLDQYSPPQKQLPFMKGKQSFKHVPQKVSLLTNNLWLVNSATPLQNKNTKAPEFPRDQDDNLEGDTDLQVMTIISLRGKGGISGIPFELIVSQRNGILVGLSEFWYLKCYDRYGIGGNDRTYFLDLLPEVMLSRTTVRAKIDENPALQRALEISSEMCQMKNLWEDRDGLFITPKELYETLKAKGYDWNVLLNTRGYWVLEEDAANEKPFLSTMDLLRMAKGLYHPYWLPPLT